jgi:capsular polysaccharide export protein
MTDNSRTPRRNILFLQGIATTFFARFALGLVRRGHSVHGINFNGGDRVFFPLPGAVDYRGDLAAWPAFLEARLTDWEITDIILFGDCRPLHQAAIRVALVRQLLVHVFEEGYLRPNWITHELGGANANSALRRDTAWFREEALKLPPWDGGVPVRSSFLRRAGENVLYNLASAALQWRYPHYRTHRPWPFYVEYASGLRRIARIPLAKRQLAEGLRKIAARLGPYFVFPLQLDSDYQIRQHSSSGRMAPAIAAVIGSFAAHAPADALLVVKEHPLDDGITNWRALTHQIAQRAGIEDRVVYLKGSDLEWLLCGSAGVVTINSTVGYLALSFGLPVKALGSAIYDLPDLTFQGILDAFWRNAPPPNPETFAAFRRVVANRTQVNGGFYSASGLRLAVSGAIERFERSLPRRVLATAAIAAAPVMPDILDRPVRGTIESPMTPTGLV